jgi:dihydrofolate synthase / folylpolyglutamate synthase
MLRDLFARTTSGIKLGLETTRELLAALGSPHVGRRFVVVGGTNGKGSTSALIAGALQHAGLRVGLYTSPHLLRFTERIRMNGAELDPTRALALYERIRAVEARCGRQPTFFECTTAMALLAFAESAVDIAVLEVGLGGRLDSTNAVDKVLSVITPIDLDHQIYLGDTVAQIAAEKADIIPARGAVVTAPQPPEALAVLEHVAAERGARVVHAAPWEGPLALAGAYQRMNVSTAATACRVLDELGVPVPPEAFARAAAATRWRGRYDWLAPDLLADGAHNPAGMSALLSALAADPRVGARPVHCVFAVLRDKAGEAMAAALRPRVAQLYPCVLPVRRTRTAEEMAELCRGARVYTEPTAAIEAARAAAKRDGGVALVTGSLFLVAEAIALATGEPRDPPIDS